MDTIWEFIRMGGYAAFVWPAVLVVAAGMGLLLFQSLRSLRQRERVLASLTRASADRPAAGASSPSPQTPARTVERALENDET